MVKLFRKLLVADQIGLADFGGKFDAADGVEVTQGVYTKGGHTGIGF